MTDQRSVRAVTLNTWKNEGNLPARIPAMGDGLTALSPDIVLLQEVFVASSISLDVGAELASRLGLTLAYAPARRKLRPWNGGTVMSEAGLAVLVRGSVVSAGRFSLPSEDAGGERIALVVTAIVDGQEIVAGNLHLSHLHGDDARRCEQLNAALGATAWRRRASLRVLGGDFNTTAGSQAFAALKGYPELEVRSVSSSDAALPTHPLPPRPGRAGRAIDHLFTVSVGDEPRPRILRSEVVMNQPSPRGVWPSDHAAVFSEIAFHALPDATREVTVGFV